MAGVIRAAFKAARAVARKARNVKSRVLIRAHTITRGGKSVHVGDYYRAASSAHVAARKAGGASVVTRRKRSGKGLLPKGGSRRMAAAVQGRIAAQVHARPADNSVRAWTKRSSTYARKERLYNYLKRRPGVSAAERARLGY